MNIFKRLFGAKAQWLMICAAGEETKAKSKRLGIQSIILSVVGLVGVIVFVIIGTIFAKNLASSAVGDISNAPITSFFGAIVFYAFALASFLGCSLTSTSFALFQRRLNKLKIGKVSLAISLIGILVCIVFTIIYIVLMI